MVDFAVDDLVAEDIDAYLTAHENKSLLRFITCGSVDDGKSTLIGRLLYESKMVFADHLDALTSDSARFGTQGDDLDFALLVDGLTAEREQGITIDVAYRFFTTEKRKFIVADTPGHEQYTRNMVTGASTADLAVVMIDARKGVLTQSRRHSYLVSLLGVRHVVVAVNKLDLVDYSREVFDNIEADYRDFAEKIGLTDITCIPMSALRGDNVLDRSDNTPWYTGPTLMEHLESVDVDDVIEARPFRMPVQWVNRPNLDFRGFSGQVARGTVRPGDKIRVLPAGTTSEVARIVTMDGDLPEAIVGDSITLTLTSEIDASRGDMVVADDYAPEVSDQFEAHIVWMDEHEMIPGRPYLMKIGTTTIGCAVQDLKHRVDVNTLEHLAARTLALNEIGLTTLTVDRPIPFDAYADSRDMGGFIIIDRLTNSTVGAGMLKFALRRASNVPWQATTIDKSRRASLKHQKPTLIWLTGVPGAGKSTLANALEKRLADLNYHTYLLDGDNVRHGLSRDLGFTEADRVENLRRVTHVAALMLDAGLIVITSFISPFRNEREAARDTVGDGEFVEVFLDTTLEEAEARDRKGLYAKARAGELQNFTGFDSPYEAPVAAEITVDTSETPAEEAAEQILAYLRLQGRI